MLDAIADAVSAKKELAEEFDRRYTNLRRTFGLPKAEDLETGKNAFRSRNLNDIRNIQRQRLGLVNTPKPAEPDRS